MAVKSEKLIISKDGTVRGIHGPLVDKVTRALGEPVIRRASHVEPGFEMISYHPEIPAGNESRWFASMRQSGGGLLGPFDTREEALKAETDWLLANHIPIPGVG